MAYSEWFEKIIFLILTKIYRMSIILIVILFHFIFKKRIYIIFFYKHWILQRNVFSINGITVSEKMCFEIKIIK